MWEEKGDIQEKFSGPFLFFLFFFIRLFGILSSSTIFIAYIVGGQRGEVQEKFSRLVLSFYFYIKPHILR